jgi:hypothetical protein
MIRLSELKKQEQNIAETREFLLLFLKFRHADHLHSTCPIVHPGHGDLELQKMYDVAS